VQNRFEKNLRNHFLYQLIPLIFIELIKQLKKIMAGSLKQISHEDLKKGLRTGAFKFFYRKVGGSLRIALGTLDLDRVPSLQHPKGGTSPGAKTSYYDLEKGAWRSVSESQEIWVD
jgi:hypothetical protein